MSRIQSSKKHIYLEELFNSPSPDPVLEKIKEACRDEGLERMQISSHEARILQFLIRLSKAKKVLEIGTLYAYSTWHMAKALPDDGKVWTLDISSKRHEKSREILKDSKEGQKIQWLSGRALDTLKSLETEAPFDMLFIDADKEAYLEYLDWGERHLRPGGLLVADNSFLFGAVYGETERSPKEKTIEIMQEFNKRICQGSRWEGALIPTTEGLTVGIKKG